MNANELADELKELSLIADNHTKIVLGIAETMLRQQQAEIEVLKAAKIRAYNNGVEDGRKPDTNNKPVAWMNKIATSWVTTIPDEFKDEWIPLYTHPVKELTDEEIIEIGLLTTDPRFSHIESPLLLEFARAILRKAQEK